MHLRKRSEAVQANAYDVTGGGLKYSSVVQPIGSAQDLLPHHLETNEEQRELGQDFRLGDSAIQQFFNVLDAKGNIVSHKMPARNQPPPPTLQTPGQ